MAKKNIQTNEVKDFVSNAWKISNRCIHLAILKGYENKE